MPRTRGNGSAVTVNTTTETVVATLPPVNVTAGQPVDIAWSMDHSTGTGVTGVTVNVRRGTTTGGTLVQAFGPFAEAASTRIDLAGQCVDTQNADVAGQQYVVTVTQAGATGNGTTNQAEIRADWLQPNVP